VLLIVEVADTSLVYDRETKHAEAGLPEVWLVDLNADRFEVHSEPGPDGHRKTVRFARGERVKSVTLPVLTLDADEVLPPREPEPQR
jgi:Uma2 family endonuclease